MPTYKSMGWQAGAIVTALIAGSAPAALKLPEILGDGPTRRLAADPALGDRTRPTYPKDAIVHFRDPSLWDAYRAEAIAAGTAILLLAGLSTLLFAERRSLVRTSAALKTSEQRMTHAARAAKLATWIWNSVNDRISVSPSQPLFQSAGDAPINFADVLAAVHPADRDEVKRTGAGSSRRKSANLTPNTVPIPQNGEVRWLAVRGRPDSANTRQWLGVVLDITDRKLAQLQAEQDRSRTSAYDTGVDAGTNVRLHRAPTESAAHCNTRQRRSSAADARRGARRSGGDEGDL